MPITPFIGVRISWLIVARNALFASLAASATARASRSRCALRSCSNARRTMAPTKTSGIAAELRMSAQSLDCERADVDRDEVVDQARQNVRPADRRVQREQHGAHRADAMSEPPHAPRRRDSDDPEEDRE